jgi:hypothetical protein
MSAAPGVGKWAAMERVSWKRSMWVKFISQEAASAASLLERTWRIQVEA